MKTLGTIDSPKEFETVKFESTDGLLITADYYATHKPKGFILLCHRSHCNRGEYRETAPRFNQLGFSCLAIDQRSGMKIFGVVNETSARAKQNGLATGYLDAKQDVDAAVDYAYKLNNNHPVILLGSSYSASLALLIAATDSKKIDAVMTFSPGECLKGINLAEEIKPIRKPIFATSAKKESEDVSHLFRHVNPSCVHQFKPSVDGFHGSKTLWNSVKGSEANWKAAEKFLFALHT